MSDLIIQIVLAALSVTAIILVARKNKWGWVFGLASQPFWFITSYMNQQWGVFFITIVYTFSWAYGIYEWFWRNKETNK